jgi:hypothetical protein
MALREFPSDKGRNDELPWVNEYLDDGGEPNTASFVTDVRKSAKGIMVIAEDYKGFLFKNSSIHDFLLEALDAWITNGTINYPLFAIALEDGKVNLAVDDELEPSVWVVVTKNKHWTQKEKGKGRWVESSKIKPLLTNSSPHYCTYTQGKYQFFCRGTDHDRTLEAAISLAKYFEGSVLMD